MSRVMERTALAVAVTLGNRNTHQLSAY